MLLQKKKRGGGTNFPWEKTGMASGEPHQHPVAVAQAQLICKHHQYA